MQADPAKPCPSSRPPGKTEAKPLWAPEIWEAILDRRQSISLQPEDLSDGFLFGVG